MPEQPFICWKVYWRTDFTNFAAKKQFFCLKLEEMWCTFLAVLAATSVGVVESYGCGYYSVLSDWSRAISSHSYDCNGDDGYLNGWYRFIGDAGDKMLDYCPASNYGTCGSRYKGWFAGPHPHYYQGAVQRTVYFAYNGNCYYSSTTITVINCGGYYVYRLTSPSIYCARYCGAGYSYSSVLPVSSSLDMFATSSVDIEASSISPSSDFEVQMSSAAPERKHRPDGCRHYQIIHDGTRSALYRDWTYSRCDNHLHGWYRFTGEAGNRMLNYCPLRVNGSSHYGHQCGSYYQGWIPSGSMPSVYEGEVSRMVCFSPPGTCYCYHRTQIKVRNCGKFFVYWLNGVPQCNLRYCSVKDDSATVSCSEYYMRIDLDKRYYDVSEYSSITLRDPSCKATFSSNHISLDTIPNSCGSSRRETSNHIIYENEVILKAGRKDGLITRETDQKIRFTCSYSKYGYVSSVSFKPISTLNATERGIGRFTFNFRMYKDKTYNQMNYRFPVQVSVRDWLYFEAYASVSDNNLVLLIDRCYSTPTINRNHPDKYLFINERCPIDDSVQFHKTTRNRQRFSIQAFKYTQNSSVVYVHCVVFLCNRTSTSYRCNSACQGNSIHRAKRDLEGGSDYKDDKRSYSKYYLLEAGPIELGEDKIKGEKDKQETASGFSTTTLLLIIGIAALALVIVGLILRMRRSTTVVQKTAAEIGIDNASPGEQYALPDEVLEKEKQDTAEQAL